MKQTLTIHQVARATDMTRHQIAAWISRGYFVPSKAVETGKAREFTFQDAFRLGCAVELTRLGINPADTAVVTQELYGFQDDIAFLVVSQGPIEVPTIVTANGPGIVYDPDAPIKRSAIIGSKHLTEVLLDPKKRSAAVVNLDEVEKRVEAALQDEA